MSRHPRGHFLTKADTHIFDPDQMRWYQDTADEDLDGKDDFDDDNMISEDGYTTMSPSFDESEMLEALEDPPLTEPQADIEPQEAYEAMKFQAPLSAEEKIILSTTPLLQEDPHGGNSAPIRWVDDPDHFEWMTQRMKDRHKALDEVLEDEMYGMTEEEAMDRAGSEVGFKLKRMLKKAGRGIRKAGRGVRKAGVAVVKAPTRLVKKFVPSRDAGKAKMVKNLNAKLVREHTNFLMVTDRKRGINKPRSAYGAVAKLWAKNKIQQAGLPTSYTAGSQVAGDILGVDCCGSWYNPATWFSKKVKYVLLNTEGERLAEMTQTEYEAYAGTKAAQATQQQPGEPPPEGAEAPPEEAPPEIPEEGPPSEETEAEAAGDWKAVTEAFRQGKKAGESEFSPESESESEGDLMGKYYRSIKDPLADIDGDIYVDGSGDIVRASELSGDFVGQFVDGCRDVSRGAMEEALVEATGDADVGRKFRGIRRALGKVRGHRHHKTPPSPEALALKARIKAQIPSKEVSKALVQKWATARSGQPSGRKRRKFYKRMKHAINKRGAKVTKTKSETAGMGDFVGWA